MFRVGMLSLLVLVIAGCAGLKGPGYVARQNECKRIGEYVKGDDLGLNPGSNKFRACMARLYNQGFASELDPPRTKSSAGSFRPLTLEGLSGGLLTNKPRQQSPDRPVAFLKSERTSGFNKICIYDRLGSEEAHNFKATDICPQMMR